MTTKQLGNIGEARVLSEFIKYGIPVYLPFGDNEKADLIAEFNGKLNKIQVKTSEKSTKDFLKFSINSSSKHRSKGKIHVYSKEEIDYFALYNLEKDIILLIKVEEVGNNSATFRFDLPKNCQKTNIKFVKDYLFKTIIKSS